LITNRLGYKLIHKDTIAVKDDNGNIFRVDRLLNGKLKHIREGMKHSDESKRKMSDNKLGVYLWNKGGEYTDESKSKISDFRRGYLKNNPDFQTGEKNPNYSKKWMYNLELKRSKSFTKDEISKMEKEGWNIGRKFFKK